MLAPSDLVHAAVVCMVLGAGMALIGSPLILVYFSLEKLFG